MRRHGTETRTRPVGSPNSARSQDGMSLNSSDLGVKEPATGLVEVKGTRAEKGGPGHMNQKSQETRAMGRV